MSHRRFAVSLHQGIALFAEELWDRENVVYRVEVHTPTTTSYSFDTSLILDRAMMRLRQEIVTHLRDAHRYPIDAAEVSGE